MVTGTLLGWSSDLHESVEPKPKRGFRNKLGGSQNCERCKEMSGPGRSVRLVELVGSTRLGEMFRRKVRQRRWGVTLVTLGVAAIGLWLFSDILGSTGWSPVKVSSLPFSACFLQPSLLGLLRLSSAFWSWPRDMSPLRLRILWMTIRRWRRPRW